MVLACNQNTILENTLKVALVRTHNGSVKFYLCSVQQLRTCITDKQLHSARLHPAYCGDRVIAMQSKGHIYALHKNNNLLSNVYFGIRKKVIWSKIKPRFGCNLFLHIHHLNNVMTDLILPILLW